MQLDSIVYLSKDRESDLRKLHNYMVCDYVSCIIGIKILYQSYCPSQQ